MEIWVAGYPSLCGGADSELLHAIDLWLLYGVSVNLVPMGGCDPAMRAACEARGCRTWEFRPDIFKDRVVASWCNGEFLKKLPRIVTAGRPKLTCWMNCMTWVFPLERIAHRHGMIDLHGFVSNYQRGWLKPELEKIRPVRELEGYRPYYSATNASQNLSFEYRPPTDHFAIGRVSRDDSNKFSADMWSIFNKVCSPRPTKTFVLGYGANAHARCGSAPAGLDWQTWTPNAIPVRELYGRLHCLIHKTGGSRESYCRIVPEAYAAGVPVIVERDYAFPDLVIDGVTGFMCSSSDEMSFRASQLAFDEPRRKAMIFTARKFLEEEIASPEKCWAAWEKIL